MQRMAGRVFFIALAVLAAWVDTAAPQSFPVKPVTLIVPFIAGGSTDVTFRSLAAATTRHLGQSVVIENRGGGSALLPAIEMATTRPDGYTLTQMLDNLWMAPFVSKASFDPIKDFTYVIGITGYTYGFVVRADSPWKTFEDFLAAAEKSPGKLTYATSGIYSTPQITMERIARLRGLKLVQVPFKGNADQINALMGGHIDSISSSTAWASQVNAGQFRLLVTFGATRTKSWPSVPTLKESGIDMVVDAPYGLIGPAGMDPGIVKTLHDAFKKGMEEPSFAETLKQLDQDPLYLNSGDFREFAIKRMNENKLIVQALGLKPE